VLLVASGSVSGAYLRYGDGDVGLVLGSHDQMQDADAALAAGKP